MATYAFANGKGGVGKTVTALNTGVALSRSGHDAVVVDADLTMGDLDGDVEAGLHAVLAGDSDLVDALVSGPAGLTILPGDRSIDAIGDADAGLLPRVYERLEEEFEFVLVDTPPGCRNELPISLGAADGTLLVTTPETTATASADCTGRLAEEVDATVCGLVVTRATAGTDRDSIESEVGYPVVGVVPEDPAVATTTSVVDGDGSAGVGYDALARFLVACRETDDHREALDRVGRPSMPTGDDRPEGPSTAGSGGSSVDALVADDSRMGAARSAEEHLERVRDAIDRTGRDET